MESAALDTRSAPPGVSVTNWSRWRFRVFVSAWVLYAAYYFCRKNFSVIMPMMARDSHYGNFDLAQLVFVFSLAYAIGQFAAGVMGDRLGGRFTGVLGAVVSAVCTGAMAAFAHDRQALLMLQIGNGLGQGCGWSACLKVLRAWFERRERGTVMAWWGTCYVLGGFLATVFATFAATQAMVLPNLGWGRGFLFPAIVLAFAAAWFAIGARNSPEETGLPACAPDDKDAAASGSAWEAARNVEVWILAGMYFFLKITRYSLLFWLPLYLVQRMQYSPEWAGYTSSLFELVGFSGALIAGYVSDRLLNGRRYPVGATMLFLLAGWLVIHPVVGRLGPAAMAMSISMLGILVYGPDLLMSGPASVDAVPAEHAAGRGDCEWSGIAGAVDLGLRGGDDREPFRLGPAFHVLPDLRGGGGYAADAAMEQGIDTGAENFVSFQYLKALIVDWAGTTVDFGSLAPVAALQRVFEVSGVPVTAAEVRAHMGTLKKDQIRSICAGDRVAAAWAACHGHAPTETDVERLFAEFLPQQSEILTEFSAPIPGVTETVERWRAAGLRIGSTTGYTRELLDIVLPAAAAQGYSPDVSVTPDEVGGGRPKPFMCYRNAILLGVYPLWHWVKIGDTPSDIGESLNAGM
ncbi:MAG TPA: phosphonoacetaldehyde hydrolase [Bryobacteraceae bacterium]